MAASDQTDLLKLSQFAPMDQRLKMDDYNSDMQKIDAGVKAVQDSIPTQADQIGYTNPAMPDVANVRSALDAQGADLQAHISKTVDGESGMHGIRYFNNTLQAYDGSKWVEV